MQCSFETDKFFAGKAKPYPVRSHLVSMKKENFAAFCRGEVKVMSAAKAFGMGINIQDINYIRKIGEADSSY